MTRSVVPVSRVSCGVPATHTVSLKPIWTLMTSPTLYVPLAVPEVTLVTVGGVVSGGGLRMKLSKTS